MPRITNVTGIAINNRGFMRLSFFRLLIAFGYWKREGGQNREYVRRQTGAEVHSHRWVCGPVFYLLRAITTLGNTMT